MKLITTLFNLTKDKGSSAGGKTGSVRVIGKDDAYYQLKKPIEKASFKQKIGHRFTNQSLTIKDYGNIGEFISATIVNEIITGSVPTVLLVNDENNKETLIASKYVNNKAETLAAYTKNTGKKIASDANILSGDENNEALNTSLKKDLAMGLAISIFIGDHDVNLGNFVVTDDEEKKKITRIDLGNSYNAFTHKQSTKIFHNYAIDYLDREHINRDTKGTKPKLWRDHKNITVSNELAEALENLAKEGEEKLEKGITLASDSIKEFYKNCKTTKQKNSLLLSLNQIAKNIDPTYTPYYSNKSRYDHSEYVITQIFSRIKTFHKNNIDDMKIAAQIIKLQVNIDKSIPSHESYIASTYQKDFDSIITNTIQDPSKDNGKKEITWVNYKEGAALKCTLEEFIKKRTKELQNFKDRASAIQNLESKNHPAVLTDTVHSSEVTTIVHLNEVRIVDDYFKHKDTTKKQR